MRKEKRACSLGVGRRNTCIGKRSFAERIFLQRNPYGIMQRQWGRRTLRGRLTQNRRADREAKNEIEPEIQRATPAGSGACIQDVVSSMTSWVVWKVAVF